MKSGWYSAKIMQRLYITLLTKPPMSYDIWRQESRCVLIYSEWWKREYSPIDAFNKEESFPIVGAFSWHCEISRSPVGSSNGEWSRDNWSDTGCSTHILLPPMVSYKPLASDPVYIALVRYLLSCLHYQICFYIKARILINAFEVTFKV